MVKLEPRPFLKEDTEFFTEIVAASGKWRSNELRGMGLSSYMSQYEELEGEWRVWEKDGRQVAVSFHLESAPSNEKPWLGTLLVKPSERRKGIAHHIIRRLGAELSEKGNKAFFSGVPIDEFEWINFLSDCGFEQLKSEENDGETFLVMVLPLK